MACHHGLVEAVLAHVFKGALHVRHVALQGENLLAAQHLGAVRRESVQLLGKRTHPLAEGLVDHLERFRRAVAHDGLARHQLLERRVQKLRVPRVRSRVFHRVILDELVHLEHEGVDLRNSAVALELHLGERVLKLCVHLVVPGQALA